MHTHIYIYIHVYYIIILGLGVKVWRFKPLFVCCAIEAKFLPFEALLTLPLYVVHVWLIMWTCSRKVEAVLLAAFVLFLSPAMPNLYRNTDRNNTSTRNNPVLEAFYSQSRYMCACRSNIDKNTCEPSNLCLFLLMKLQRLPLSQS